MASDLKTQIALRALDSFENFARDMLVGKAQQESDRELAMAEFLFKNEYAQQQENIAEIKRLGLKMNPELQTDNLEYFAENAGDKNYMQLLGGITRNAYNNKMNMNAAIGDYNRGINQAKLLRGQGAFTTPGEIGIPALTASLDEIGGLTPQQLAEEDRINRNFMLSLIHI